MTINKEQNGKNLKLSLVGRLDTTTAPLFEETVNFIDGVDFLTIDLAELEYVSSAGLRVLLMAQKKMNALGKMEIVNVNETVNEVLEMTGFADILTIK